MAGETIDTSSSEFLSRFRALSVPSQRAVAEQVMAEILKHPKPSDSQFGEVPVQDESGEIVGYLVTRPRRLQMADPEFLAELMRRSHDQGENSLESVIHCLEEITAKGHAGEAISGTDDSDR